MSSDEDTPWKVYNDKPSPSNRKKKPPLFGIISIVIVLLAMFSMNLFFMLLVMIQVIFIVVGYIKDQAKWASTLSLILAVGLLYLYVDDENRTGMKEVTLQATCDNECEITYSYYDIEFTDDAQYYWSKTFTVGGEEYIKFQAYGAKSLGVTVDGEPIELMFVDGIKTAFMNGYANAEYDGWYKSN